MHTVKEILSEVENRVDISFFVYYTDHIKAVIRISNKKQSHTEKCRLMRGLWKTCYEYLFEPHTEQNFLFLSRLCRLIFVNISGMLFCIPAEATDVSLL